MEDTQDLVYCLARSAKSPDAKRAPKSETSDSSGLVFAAKKSGLFRSTDGGQTWQDAYTALNLPAPLPTTCVAVALADEIPYVFACADGKVLRSLNAGQTWDVADLDSPAPLVTAIAVSPDFANDGTLLAATLQDGIFCSTDRGVTWTGWNFGLYDPNINALAFTDAQNVVAGTQSGVFVSANGGRSWHDLDFPIDSAPVQCLAISRDKTIYAGTQDKGLVLSQDAGKTWETVIAGSVEQIHIHNGRIFILNDGILRFSDDGKNWQIRELDVDISTFIASPMLVGLSNGEIIKL